MEKLNSYDSFEYDVQTEVIAEAREYEDSDGEVVKVPAQKRIIMRGVLQKADTLNQNGRVYPRSVLEREVRNYQKFIIENRAMGELDHPDDCVPTGTEIFTRDGWRKIEDVQQGDVVATINVKTNEIQYQRVQKKIDKHYDGKMYRFHNSRTYDMTVTPRHRVLMWDRNNSANFVYASDVYSQAKLGDSKLSHSGLRRSGTWHGEFQEQFEIANKVVDSKLWAAFLGIYLAEGHSSGVYSSARRKLNIVALTQNEGPTCDAIRTLVQRLPWQFKEYVRGQRHDFVIKDAALHAHLIDLGGSREKHVPLYVKSWDTELLQELLDWMLLGDGRHRKGYKQECVVPEYCTVSTQLADDVYDIMLKLGTGASVHTYTCETDIKAPDFVETGRMIKADNKKPMNIVYQHSSKGISLDTRFMNAEVFDYSGDIHCVVTPNQTWLMRQNGKSCWTGNSVVNLKNVSHIIREASIDSNGVVSGKIEVLNTPSGRILQDLIAANVKLGISSRGVGTTKKDGDYFVVQDDFQLICWDMVSEPSTPGAFMLPESRRIVSSTEIQKVFTKSDRIDRILNDILNK